MSDGKKRGLRRWLRCGEAAWNGLRKKTSELRARLEGARHRTLDDAVSRLARRPVRTTPEPEQIPEETKPLDEAARESAPEAGPSEATSGALPPRVPEAGEREAGADAPAVDASETQSAWAVPPETEASPSPRPLSREDASAPGSPEFASPTPSRTSGPDASEASSPEPASPTPPRTSRSVASAAGPSEPASLQSQPPKAASSGAEPPSRAGRAGRELPETAPLRAPVVYLLSPRGDEVFVAWAVAEETLRSGARVLVRILEGEQIVAETQVWSPRGELFFQVAGAQRVERAELIAGDTLLARSRPVPEPPGSAARRPGERRFVRLAPTEDAYEASPASPPPWWPRQGWPVHAPGPSAWSQATVAASAPAGPWTDEPAAVLYWMAEEESIERPVSSDAFVRGVRAMSGFAPLARPQPVPSAMDVLPSPDHFWVVPASEGWAVPSSEIWAVPASEGWAVPSSEVWAVPASEGWAVPSSEVWAVPASEGWGVPSSEGWAVPSSEVWAVAASEGWAVPSSEVWAAPSSEGWVRVVPSSEGWVRVPAREYWAAEAEAALPSSEDWAKENWGVEWPSAPSSEDWPGWPGERPEAAEAPSSESLVEATFHPLDAPAGAWLRDAKRPNPVRLERFLSESTHPPGKAAAPSRETSSAPPPERGSARSEPPKAAPSHPIPSAPAAAPPSAPIKPPARASAASRYASAPRGGRLFGTLRPRVRGLLPPLRWPLAFPRPLAEEPKPPRPPLRGLNKGLKDSDRKGSGRGSLPTRSASSHGKALDARPGDGKLVGGSRAEPLRGSHKSPSLRRLLERPLSSDDES